MKTYYKLLPHNDWMDLDDFYKEAAEQGYVNNSNRKIMIDAFKNEEKSQVFILSGLDNDSRRKLILLCSYLCQKLHTSLLC